MKKLARVMLYPLLLASCSSALGYQKNCEPSTISSKSPDPREDSNYREIPSKLLAFDVNCNGVFEAPELRRIFDYLTGEDDQTITNNLEILEERRKKANEEKWKRNLYDAFLREQWAANADR